MAILLKVKWVDKADHIDPQDSIEHIGGESKELQWRHSQAQAIESIEQGLYAYYIEQNARPIALAVGHTQDGKKFLMVPPEGAFAPKLSDLPNFPKAMVPPPQAR